ncbi:hypothetical protein BDK51DRAFT_38196 [Blyttiomyces helicus]|uniref:Uncharacterized protein n=1 Tax=Blyttiomyces helicus TaxID=388810 RepID=A0A4P9VWQ4_9FUNG|nr:hypothetical protein BDK51DRAFT_37285 [Blyttiomyces helicus]RKO92157.1 hypothetical protein BDK51DRAFT_38196 [Blyttiomyces helicus]|eukprot:RKO84149.1 hypothetical protein BDK51DRAFT_37285 [Blyttiomyces helicus]
MRRIPQCSPNRVRKCSSVFKIAKKETMLAGMRPIRQRVGEELAVGPQDGLRAAQTLESGTDSSGKSTQPMQTLIPRTVKSAPEEPNDERSGSCADKNSTTSCSKNRQQKQDGNENEMSARGHWDYVIPLVLHITNPNFRENDLLTLGSFRASRNPTRGGREYAKEGDGESGAIGGAPSSEGAPVNTSNKLQMRPSLRAGVQLIFSAQAGRKG